MIAHADLSGRSKEFVRAYLLKGGEQRSCDGRNYVGTVTITCSDPLPEAHGTLHAKSCSYESGSFKCSDEITANFYTGNVEQIELMN